MENCKDLLSLGKKAKKKALEKSSSLIQKQTPAYSDVRHDWNFKGD